MDDAIGFQGFEAPNYTMLPNEFFSLLPILKANEITVFLAILNHTLRFHRMDAKISYSTFEHETGLSRKTILSAIQGLLTRNLIVKVTDVPSSFPPSPSQYLINILPSVQKFYQWKNSTNDTDDQWKNSTNDTDHQWKNSTDDGGKIPPMESPLSPYQDNELSGEENPPKESTTKEKDQVLMSDAKNDIGRPSSTPSQIHQRSRKMIVHLSEMSGESQDRWSKFMAFLYDGMSIIPVFVPLDFAQYHLHTPFLVATFIVDRTAYDPRWRVRSRDLSGWFRDMDRLVLPEQENGKGGEGLAWWYVRDMIRTIFAESERPTKPKEFKWGRVIQSVPNFREHFSQIEEEYFPNGQVSKEETEPHPVLPSWEEIRHNWE